VTNGVLPDGTQTEPGRVLIIADEDDIARVIVQRILEFGGRRDMIAAWNNDTDDAPVFDESGCRRIARTLERVKPRLVITDPLFAFIPKGTDTNSEPHMRPLIRRLDRLAADYACAFWNMRHFGKNLTGKEAHHAGSGSVAVRNRHRSQIIIRWHPEQEGVRVVSHTKHNWSPIGAGQAFGYDFKRGHFNWIYPLDDPFPKRGGGFKPGEQNPTNIIEFLKDFLSFGERESEEVKTAAEKVGLQPKSKAFRVARERVTSWRREGFGSSAVFYWRLKDQPVGYDPFAEDETPSKDSGQQPYWAGLDK
jgi:hypothetical protein